MYLFFLCALVTLMMFLIGCQSELGFPLVALFVSLAFYFMGHKLLKSFAFTIWVLAFVASSMFYPSAFERWFGIELKILIVPLIQIIMFGMGTTLTVKDFERVLIMPWPVFIGIFLQFSVMPIVGYSIASLLSFEPEIAAGIVLVGSVSGGVASNVMTYLASGNVALSVTMTSCSTLMSPVMTPFLMKTLGGKLIPVDFIAMMLSIFNMIIVPIVAGLIANKILQSSNKWANKVESLGLISSGIIFFVIVLIFFRENFLGPLATLKNGIILGFSLIGIIALVKLIINLLLKVPQNWFYEALPIVSMFCICFIIAIITAQSRDTLLTVGMKLLLAVFIHNSVGYFLGYWGAKAAKLDERSCRTVAFEVGMQNGGMATGIAMDVLKSAKAALAPAIFGPWMNISGSVLANWWRRKPI
ncbi:MAG: bile acid:sodium symporter family protein [Acidobacteriota bacterium]